MARRGLVKVAITGGTGFVGSHLARSLAASGHEVVLVARGLDQRQLAAAFTRCEVVAHCAGINRELGAQTYARVHVRGTEAVVGAARSAGVRKLVMMSFLRARPNCGSAYHESKWRAEELIRGSGLDYTILKSGVVYGRGDHMLDHLSRAFYTFPFFLLVGLRERPVRPLAVGDLVRVMQAALVADAMSRQTVAVLGPEEMDLGEAVRRVARACGRNPVMIRAPVAVHRVMAWGFERTMKIPLVSLAQVRILSEGVVEPLPFAQDPPDGLLPATPFSEASIRGGLPPPGPFGVRDLRCSPA